MCVGQDDEGGYENCNICYFVKQKPGTKKRLNSGRELSL